MNSADPVFTRFLRRPIPVLLPAASVILVSFGCMNLPGVGEAPKSIQVRFSTFDVGFDDCEDILSFGDFTVQMTVTVQPGNEQVFTASRSAKLV